MEAMDWNDRPTIQVRVLLYQAPNLPGVHLPHLGGMLVRGEEKRNPAEPGGRELTSEVVGERGLFIYYWLHLSSL